MIAMFVQLILVTLLLDVPTLLFHAKIMNHVLLSIAITQMDVSMTQLIVTIMMHVL
jgi:hypothetical protein